MGHISNLVDDQDKQIVVNNEVTKPNDNIISKKLNIITQAKKLRERQAKKSIKKRSYEPKESITSTILDHPSMPKGPIIITKAKKPIKELSYELSKCNKEVVTTTNPSMPKALSYEKHLACGKPARKGSISKINVKRKVYPVVRVIEMSPPTLVTTKPEDFMSVVQKLTGSPSSSSTHVMPLEDMPLFNPLDSDTDDPNLQGRVIEEGDEYIELLAVDDGNPSHHEGMQDPSLLKIESFLQGDDVHGSSTMNHDSSVDHVCISNTSDELSSENTIHFSPLQWDLLDEINGMWPAPPPQVGITSASAQLLDGYAVSAWDAQYHLIYS